MKYKYYFRLIFNKRIFLKKSFVFILLAITIPVVFLLCLSNYFGSIFEKNENHVEKMTGNWHFAYILENEESIRKIADLPEVFGVGKIFCIKEYDIAKKNDYTILGCNKKTQNMMIKLVEGDFAENRNEMVIPDYISQKYHLSIGAKYILGKNTYAISGIYASKRGETVYYANMGIKNLKKQCKLTNEFIYGNYYDQMQTRNERKEQYLAVVRLKNHVNLKKVSQKISGIKGVKKFPCEDAYGITYDSKETFWYNGDLLQTQNYYNGGYLIQNSYRFQKNKLLFFMIVVTSVMAFLFLCIFQFISYREDNKTIDVYKSLGIGLFALVIIRITEKLIHVNSSLCLGVVLGKLFCYVLYGKCYTIENIVVFAMLGTIFLYIILELFGIIKKYYQDENKNSTSLLYYDNISCGERSKFSFIWKKGLFIIRYAFRNVNLNKRRSTLFFLFYFVIFLSVSFIFTEYKFERSVGNRKEDNCNLWLDMKQKKEIDHLVSQLSKIEGIKDIVAPLCYIQDYEDGSKEVVAKLDKEKIKKIFYNYLMMSDYEEYINYSANMSLTHVGVIGCNVSTINDLKKYVVEGDINKLQNDKYIFLPKYCEGYENINVNLTSYKIGDKIEIGYDHNNQEDAKVYHKKKFEIAGFIKYNPYECSNGVSSKFSVLMSENSLMTLLGNSENCFSNKIYIKYNKKQEDQICSQLRQMGKSEFKFIVHTNSNILVDIAYSNELMMLYYILFAIIVTLTVYFALFIWLKNRNKNEEYWVLYSVGFCEAHFKIMNCVEFFIPSILSLPVGFIAYHMIVDWLNPEILISWGEIVTFFDILGIALLMFTMGGGMSCLGIGKWHERNFTANKRNISGE